MKEKLNSSWSQTFVLAEEMGREVSRNISYPQFPDTTMKTEETRPTTAHIINHNIKANVWTEIKLPRDMEAWQMSCRDDYEIQYCFEPSASTYKTLRAGAIVSEDTSPNKDINAVYVRCANDTTVEIELWKT